MRKEIKIDGMKCENCQKHVEEELLKIDGVEKVKADKDKKRAIVTLSKDVKDDVFISQIDNNTNFKVVSIKKLLF